MEQQYNGIEIGTFLSDDQKSACKNKKKINNNFQKYKVENGNVLYIHIGTGNSGQKKLCKDIS